MKKIYFALILGLLYRQAAAKIEYHYNQLVFQNGSHPYVECAFSINPLSINYKTLADKKLQGQLTVTIYFKQNDQVIVFDKFGLMTNKFDSANAIIQDPAAILTVKHYQLKPGQYKVDVDVSDGISNEELKDLPLTVNYIDSKINLSSIELIDTFNQATDTLHQTFFKSGLLISGKSSPEARTVGCLPSERCKSEAPCFRTRSSNSSSCFLYSIFYKNKIAIFLKTFP